MTSGLVLKWLNGERFVIRRRYKVALAALRKLPLTVPRLPYDEPWGWIQPTRHALGALLLGQGNVSEAEAVYRADLGLDATLSRACQHPAMSGAFTVSTDVGPDAGTPSKPRISSCNWTRLSPGPAYPCGRRAIAATPKPPPPPPPHYDFDLGPSPRF